MKLTRQSGWRPGYCTCFLGELGHSGQHRRVPGLKEIDHEQGQGVVIEKWATPWVNNQLIPVRLEAVLIPSLAVFATLVPVPATFLLSLSPCLCPDTNTAPSLS